jgi:small-conductance mechanosensitive channel
VLGLALQPILSNLFAGIIILSTRYIEVGKNIKILSSQIPFGLVPLPPYKFLSVENTDLGYKGSIKKVTLFYSIFQSEEGEEIKIPNAILLNSVILERDKENAIISVRVEFPLKLKIGLEKLEDEIKRSLKGFNIVEGPYFNEQSDKEHVFITLKVESKDNWKKTKSEVLKRLLILKEKLKKKR